MTFLLTLISLTFMGCVRDLESRHKILVPSESFDRLRTALENNDQDEARRIVFEPGDSILRQRLFALAMYAYSDDKKAFDFLMQYYDDFDNRQEIWDGRTLLMTAVIIGDLDMFNALIDREVAAGKLNERCINANRVYVAGEGINVLGYTALDFANAILNRLGLDQALVDEIAPGANYNAIRAILVEKGAQVNLVERN